MKIRKTTIAKQMAEKAYDALGQHGKESVHAASGENGRYSREQEARQDHPLTWDHKIETNTKMPPQSNQKQGIPALSKREQKSSMNIWRTIWKKG